MLQEKKRRRASYARQLRLERLRAVCAQLDRDLTHDLRSDPGVRFPTGKYFVDSHVV